MIVYNCDCGRQFRVADEEAGHKVRCPTCGAVGRVPGETQLTDGSIPGTNPPAEQQESPLQLAASAPIGTGTVSVAFPQELTTKENLPVSSQAPDAPSSPKTLIDKLRQEFHDAMRSVDVQAGEEIRSGQEMKGVMTHMSGLTKLTEIHQQLTTYYVALFRNSDLLKRNDSQRLKQVGHEMLPTLELLKEVDATDEVKEQFVVNGMRKIGLRRIHWFLKERFLLEIEYMLDALSILIEPEFMPIPSSTNLSPEEEADRYIPSEVKLAVWRRDQGKCTQCGSKEKLEYDHIIPISRGGSNTERNVQLLCQVCNRRKAAAVQ